MKKTRVFAVAELNREELYREVKGLDPSANVHCTQEGRDAPVLVEVEYEDKLMGEQIQARLDSHVPIKTEEETLSEASGDRVVAIFEAMTNRQKTAIKAALGIK